MCLPRICNKGVTCSCTETELSCDKLALNPATPPTGWPPLLWRATTRSRHQPADPTKNNENPIKDGGGKSGLRPTNHRRTGSTRLCTLHQQRLCGSVPTHTLITNSHCHLFSLCGTYFFPQTHFRIIQIYLTRICITMITHSL